MTQSDPTPELDIQPEAAPSVEEYSEENPPPDPQPPAPKSVVTRIDEIDLGMGETPDVPPESEAPNPPQPMQTPKLSDLVDDSPIDLHDCRLPLAFIEHETALCDYVKKNEHLMDVRRRRIDISKPVIRQGYPIYRQARVSHGFHPSTAHWYAAALILIAMGVSIKDAEKGDTNEILDSLEDMNPRHQS